VKPGLAARRPRRPGVKRVTRVQGKTSWRRAAAIGWAGVALTVARSVPVAAEENSVAAVSRQDDSLIQDKIKIVEALHQERLISDKQFQRENHELELSATLFTNKCPPRAYVPRKIYFAFKKTNQAKVRDLIQRYALQGKIDLPSTAERGFGTIQVDEGHEWFWVDALQSSGLFDSVDRRGYSCPESVDAIVGVSHPQTTLASPAFSVGATGPQPLQAALDYIRASFPSPAQVNLLESGPSHLKLELIGFKDRVLSGRRFWERLEIHLVQLAPSSTGSQPPVMAIVDGYFATGVGDNQPSLSAYQSMEQQYYADLVRFTGILFTKL
jgi:hypothetical protein